MGLFGQIISVDWAFTTGPCNGNNLRRFVFLQVPSVDVICKYGFLIVRLLQLED